MQMMVCFCSSSSCSGQGPLTLSHGPLDPKVQGTRGAHSVMDLWQRSQPMAGPAGQVLGMLEVVGAGEAVEQASRRIEDWEGWGQGLSASKESIAR